MASDNPRRRLIVNADDFGRSASINAAVIQAHREGILTSASLMVNGDAFEEAVTLAKENPRLGVGLHLALCSGRSTLAGEFADTPVTSGLTYFFDRGARPSLQAEIGAQFSKFAKTGLPLDHVNGHLHFHLHPTVFRILLQNHRLPAFRWTNNPLSIDWPLGRGRWLYRLSHAFVFGILSRLARTELRRERIAHVPHVFGLLENARVTEAYILKLLRVLPEGESELYSHPSLHEFRHEFDALMSPRVKQAVAEEGIQLIRYQDL